MVFLEAIYPIFVVAFSVDLEGFSFRFRVEAAPTIPIASKPAIFPDSGTATAGSVGIGSMVGSGRVLGGGRGEGTRKIRATCVA